MSDTPDDPTQDAAIERTILASAYLDGEVTPDERARVESDQELLDEVESLRQVRAVLGATAEPAPVSVRENHLAAALDVFDRMGETDPRDATPSAASATPTPLAARRTRRDWNRTLLGAAAALVIVAGVGAVIRGVMVGTGDDDDSDASDAAPADEPADEPAEEEADAALESGALERIDEGEVFDSGGDAESADEPAFEPADESATEPADESDEAMEEEPAEEATDDAASDPSDPPAEADLVELSTEQDLIDFAAPAAFAPDGEFDAEAPFTTCADEFGIDRLAEPAVVDGVQVNIGIDIDTLTAFAYTDECVEVLTAPLPTEDEWRAANADGAPTPTTEAP